MLIREIWNAAGFLPEERIMCANTIQYNAYDGRKEEGDIYMEKIIQKLTQYWQEKTNHGCYEMQRRSQSSDSTGGG